jgi:hypothetical protein
VETAVEEHRDGKTRLFVELAISYGLILATIWCPLSVRRYLWWTAIFWILLVAVFAAWKGERFGLGVSGFRQSLWALSAAAIFVTLEIACAAALGTLDIHYFAPPHPPMLGYFIFCFVQQFILQNLFLVRLLRLLGRPSRAIAAAGVMMSLAHLPNFLLTIATLLWGTAACWLFLRYRNLWAVGLIHFLLGISMAICVPGSVHHHMRVGRSYSLYHHHVAAVPAPGVGTHAP